MHSPGQSRAASITLLVAAAAAPRPGCREPPGIVERARRPRARRRCRPRAARTRRGSGRGTGRRPCTGPGRSTPASAAGYGRAAGPERGRVRLAAGSCRVPATIPSTRRAHRAAGRQARPRTWRPPRRRPSSTTRGRGCADRDDPDTLAYLEAENAYADAWFDDAGRPLRRRGLRRDQGARTQETDLSVPVRKGAVVVPDPHGRGPDLPDPLPRPRPAATATEQVLLDENAEADGHDYFAVGAFDVSPSARLLAWSSDTRRRRGATRCGSATSPTGEDLPDALERTYYGTAWSADERVPVLRRARRRHAPVPGLAPPPRARRRPTTSSCSQEDDERFFVGVDLSRSEQVDRDHHRVEAPSSEVWVLPAGDPPTPSRARRRPRRPTTSTRSTTGATGS